MKKVFITGGAGYVGAVWFPIYLNKVLKLRFRSYDLW